MTGVGRNYGPYGHADDALRCRVGSDVLLRARLSHWRACCFSDVSDGGAPAVLGAVVISMNPVVTALLAALFLKEGLTWMRVAALALGVLAVLAACAGRLVAIGGVDAVLLLLLVALISLAAGGV